MHLIYPRKLTRQLASAICVCAVLLGLIIGLGSLELGWADVNLARVLMTGIPIIWALWYTVYMLVIAPARDPGQR